MGALISAVVLNYNAGVDALRRCLGSLRAQTYPELEIVLVDNGSVPGPLQAVAAEYPEARIVPLGRNLGFAGGVNQGIAVARGDLVLILNYDVELEGACVHALAKALEADDGLAGVAPKTVFMHDRHLIDSVGNLIDPFGAAYNMGIGQLDIGQYDVGEPVFGACFSAALCRRAAFDTAEVGPLDEGYFMYYEDVDWCYRANLLGWRFRTAPEGLVAHVHSDSVRRLAYADKYYLIERNLLRTVCKNFEAARALTVLRDRTLGHLAKALRRDPFWRAGLRAVVGAWACLPQDLRARAQVQRRRRVPDPEIFRHSFGEAPYFDPARYAPIASLETLEAMYRRRAVITGDRRSGEIAAAVTHLRTSKLRFNPEGRARRLAELLREEPPRVRDFAAKIDS
jgi:hypothetical protein